MKKKKVAEYTPKKIDTIREMLDLAATEAPEKVAYRYKNKSGDVVDVSFSEFSEATEALGTALTARGFGYSHIACISENRYEWIVVYLAVLKSAGVFVPIDKELPPDNKMFLLCDSECDVVFYSAKQKKHIDEIKDTVPNVKLFVCLDDCDDEDTVTLSTLLKEGSLCENRESKVEYDGMTTDPNELKMLVYTSGTTGIAKGVMLTEHNLVSGIYYGLQVSRIYDVGLSVLPYNHTYEAVCDILVSIHSRATLCICSGIKEVVKEMKLYKPDYIYLVPAFTEFMYSSIMKNIKKQGKEKKFNTAIKLSKKMLKLGIDMRKTLFGDIVEGVFGGNLKKIVCGGAPIRPEIGEFFGDLGVVLTGGYGITECSPLVSVNDDKTNNYATAGMRLPCLRWKIVDPDEDGIGEITVKGDVVMKGYYKQPEKTAEVLKDGWFSTGDYGYITDDDNLVITGRKKNIIVLSNGKNVYPEEIEEYVMKVDGISEVVVRSIKNEKGDEVGLSAEIFLSDEGKEMTEKDVLDAIRAVQKDLPGYKRVSEVILREEPFERTSSNKIRR